MSAHDNVVALPYLQVVANAESATNDLKQFAADTVKMRVPVNRDEVIGKLQHMHTRLLDSFREVDRFLQHVDVVSKKCGSDGRALKKTWGNDRDYKKLYILRVVCQSVSRR